MLAAAHFHRLAFGDRGTDRIGADPRLVPAGARHQCHTTGLVEEAGAAFGIQDPAVGIGEDDDAAGAVGIGGEHLHFRARQSPQAFVLFAHVAQTPGIDRLDRQAAVGGQPQRAATPPRLQDRVAHLADRCAAMVEERPARQRDIGLGWIRMRWHARHRNVLRQCVAFCDNGIACCSDTQHRLRHPATTFDAALRQGFGRWRAVIGICAMTRCSTPAWHAACAIAGTRTGSQYAWSPR